MTRALPAAALAAAAACLIGLTACGGDDGNAVGSGSGSGSGAGSGQGTGSGSGLSSSDVGTPSGDKDVEAAAGTYRTYVLGQVSTLQAKVKTFTDAVRAGDVAAAKTAYGPSRVGWEAIEPIAGLVPEIDGATDSRVDDFSGPNDPKFTGWHRLELILWTTNSTAGAKPFADQLDKDIATLATKIQTVPITAKAAALGAGELVDEAAKGKITGEEDRYSHTDFYDFAGNIDGAKAVLTAFQSVLSAKDKSLSTTLDGQFGAVAATLAPYRDGDGWKPYTALTAADKTKLQGQLASLAESLSKLPAALGVA
jgi:iron uptake system component EfeO